MNFSKSSPPPAPPEAPNPVPVPEDALTRKPWRFRPGALVNVLGHPQDILFEVIGGELWRGFPHYLLRDTVTGDTWLIPQLHIASKPITFRKG
jgi:hypothetical protein